MSSHHIVREKQEPALLLLGLDNFDDELLGQLLEWSPTVITTPLTAEQVNSQGIKVDIIIADETDLNIQSDVRLIHPGSSTISAAFNFLLINEYKAVNIVTSILPLAELQPYANKINMVIFCGHKKIYPVISGFNKWKPAGENIYTLSFAGGLMLQGLAKAGADTYTTTHDGFINIQFNAPFLFIAEEI